MKDQTKFKANKFFICLLLLILPQIGFSQIVDAGTGSYTTALPSGQSGPQDAIYKAAGFSGRMQTGQWWSSLTWVQYSEPLFAHPLSVKCTDQGIEISTPNRWYYEQTDGEVSVMQTHRNDFVLQSSAFNPLDARLEKYSDWAVDILMANGSNQMKATVAHGSPYLYITVIGGNIILTFNGDVTVWYGTTSSQYRGVTILGNHYGLFAPAGATWTDQGPAKITCILPAGKNYFSIAALPDNTPSTLNYYYSHAYAFIINTVANYTYNESTGKVNTIYNLTTVAKEGSNTDTIMALYPHQWRNNPSLTLLPYQYSTIRGIMKTIAGKGFQTTYTYNGILPYLPDAGSYNRNTLYNLVNQEAALTISGSDTYWSGKLLGRAVNLLPVAEQIGHTSAANNAVQAVKGILENWLKADQGKTANLFYYNNNWNTLIGYPAAYGSDTSLNDHHFHYGYWVYAAAQIALRDPDWAADNRWGSMIKMLIRDYASGDRNDALFPYLRGFDIYEGHSWASGDCKFADGNNQESSSEAMNAHAALILWGEATGNKGIRDLGIYQFVTELSAIQDYWFDIHTDIFPAQYKNIDIGILWGGKYDHQTWFGDEPVFVHGIQWLPMAGHSIYLGLYPDYIEKNYDAMMNEYAERGESMTAWHDIAYEYLALGNADRAAALWNTSLTPESGETKAHTYHWIYNMKELGCADVSVTADTPLYGVFQKNSQRTYIAYNASATAKTVHFSNGTTLNVASRSMAFSGDNPPLITPTPEFTLGDVNNDGTINILDALLIAQYTVGFNPVIANPAGMDVNHSGTVDMVDALLIAQYAVDIITEFPTPIPTITPTPTLTPVPTISRTPTPTPTAVPNNGYTFTGTLPNGLINGSQVSYTTTASYDGTNVNITFNGGSGFEWVWLYTPDYYNMSYAGNNIWTASIGGYSPGSTIEYYFTVRKDGQEANNSTARHIWIVQTGNIIPTLTPTRTPTPIITSTQTPTGTPGGYTLVWSDEFTTSIGPDWVFEIGNGSSGWGNNELEYYRKENAAVSGGVLQITAKKESYGGYSYTSTRMKTQGKKSFTYGKIEARIKLPSGSGLWPAFWMLGDNISSAGWPACGEIDIMEHINTENIIYGTIHWDYNGHAQYGGNTACNPADYHVYAIEWDASSIKWFLDGVKYHEANIANNINGTDEFHKNQFILLNFAIGGNWPGFTIDESKLPAVMYVDYVRVYQK